MSNTKPAVIVEKEESEHKLWVRVCWCYETECSYCFAAYYCDHCTTKCTWCGEANQSVETQVTDTSVKGKV